MRRLWLWVMDQQPCTHQIRLLLRLTKPTTQMLRCHTCEVGFAQFQIDNRLACCGSSRNLLWGQDRDLASHALHFLAIMQMPLFRTLHTTLAGMNTTSSLRTKNAICFVGHSCHHFEWARAMTGLTFEFLLLFCCRWGCMVCWLACEQDCQNRCG